VSTGSRPTHGLGAGVASEPDLRVDNDVATLSPARPRRTGLEALISAMRPLQWIKNLLVVAAPGAAGVLGRTDVLWRVIVACVAFCLLSSATYLINDVLDAHEDRRHPRKRHRPVAAGELEPRHAIAAAALFAAVGLGACLVARPWLAAVGVAYLGLTFTYSAVWRHIAIVDVGAIAAGFVLRAGAGGIAAHVGLSRWFLLVVTCGALFVAFGKRYAELSRTNGNGATARRAVALYSPVGLAAVIGATAVGAFVAYCVWAVRFPGPEAPWRAVSIAPFGACLLRYGLLLRAGAGEAPEELFIKDRWLQLLSVAWIVVFLLSVDAAG
jgi:decaprenyl-phosphate phosphoribosyltransferase